jgi:hypothetical protein
VPCHCYIPLLGDPAWIAALEEPLFRGYECKYQRLGTVAADMPSDAIVAHRDLGSLRRCVESWTGIELAAHR